MHDHDALEAETQRTKDRYFAHLEAVDQVPSERELGRDRCPACGCPEYASGNHTRCGDRSYRCDHCGCQASLFLSP